MKLLGKVLQRPLPSRATAVARSTAASVGLQGSGTGDMSQATEAAVPVRSLTTRERASQQWRRYVIEFVDSHRDFRMAELKAVAEMLNVDWVLHDDNYDTETLHVVADFAGPEKVMADLAERSMLVRYIAVLWACGTDWTSCLQAVNKDVLARFKKGTFKFNFVSRNRKINMNRRKELFKRLAVLELEGPVRLEEPDHVHLCVEDYGPDGIRPPKEPMQVLLATLVGESKRGERIRCFDLKQRNMIGNTSMDPELSLIMANMAHARSGSFVIDPFCGTASLLLPCAFFGSHVCGSDIAFQVVHGVGKTSRTGTGSKMRGPKENIWSNFAQYGLESQFVGVLVADNARPCWVDRHVFDAIVADPPYGIREQARRIASEDKPIPEEYRETSHFPKSEAYALGSIFHDLLHFAAERLVLGGRLCFWIPEALDDGSFKLPMHPCLELVSACQQQLSLRLARRLVTMRKTRHVREGDRTVETLSSSWAVRHVVFGEAGVDAAQARQGAGKAKEEEGAGKAKEEEGALEMEEEGEEEEDEDVAGEAVRATKSQPGMAVRDVVQKQAEDDR